MSPRNVHELAAPYTLRALDPLERAVFERHLARCGSCLAELPRLQEAAAALAYGVDVPSPPPTLRDRVLARVRNAPRSAGSAAPRSALRRALPMVAAAATSLALVLAVWAASLSRALAEERAAQEAQTRALAVLSHPAAGRLRLSGADGSLVVTPGGQAALVVWGLPPAPSGKTYELWVVARDRARPAGLFAGGAPRSVVALTAPVPRGAIVGVSLEDAAGAERPTGEMLLRARAT